MKPRVCVFAFDSGESQRVALMQGAMDCARRLGDWEVIANLLGGSQFLFRLDSLATPLLLISSPHLKTIAQRQELRKSRIINLSADETDLGMPSVTDDDEKIGEMAAGYFLERGFQAFTAIVGNNAPSRRRLQGFSSALMKQDHTGLFREPLLLTDRFLTLGQDRESKVRNWLQNGRVPRRYAVFVTEDRLAYLSAWLLKRSGIEVPEAVSLLGVGDIPEFTLYGAVPISSIKLNPYERGYQAMKLGHEMVGKRKCPGVCIKIPPVEVIERRSTSGDDWADPLVARALSYIRNHANKPLSVQEVSHALGVSRRSLERRFLAACHSSPKEEITRERLRRCSSFLSSTNLLIAEIAEACGFSDYRHMGTAFRQAHGESPEAFRKRIHGSTQPARNLPREPAGSNGG